jgi:hypothetical protein
LGGRPMADGWLVAGGCTWSLAGGRDNTPGGWWSNRQISLSNRQRGSFSFTTFFSKANQPASQPASQPAQRSAHPSAAQRNPSHHAAPNLPPANQHTQLHTHNPHPTQQPQPHLHRSPPANAALENRSVAAVKPKPLPSGCLLHTSCSSSCCSPLWSSPWSSLYCNGVLRR